MKSPPLDFQQNPVEFVKVKRMTKEEKQRREIQICDRLFRSTNWTRDRKIARGNRIPLVKSATHRKASVTFNLEIFT